VYRLILCVRKPPIVFRSHIQYIHSVAERSSLRPPGSARLVDENVYTPSLSGGFKRSVKLSS
jgi:hypothetical protein